MKANHNFFQRHRNIIKLLIKSKIQNNESKSQLPNLCGIQSEAVNQVKDTK